MKESLCRPDSEHWCTECCYRSGGGCVLLGELGDGKRGCLGDGGKRVDGITQTAFCRSVNCLIHFTDEEKEAVRRMIARLPSGEFKMSEVLKELKTLKQED